MSSISSTTFPSSFSSPLDRLQSELSSEVVAGTISSSDQSALSGALSDIDTALTSQASSARGAGASPPSPGGIKSKINSLIAAEVQNGKLTSNQAAELQNVFAKTFAKGGHGGPGGAGGPRPGGAGDPGGSGGADGTGSTQTSSSSSDANQLLSDLLKLLQGSQSQTTSYGANGQTTQTTAALVLDYQS
jgi:hypothetical protein